jgi:hypothetical protein
MREEEGDGDDEDEEALRCAFSAASTAAHGVGVQVEFVSKL